MLQLNLTLTVDIQNILEYSLQLVVQDQHKSTTHASENVRPGSLEESLATLVTYNLFPAVHGATVHDVSWRKKKKQTSSF